MLFVLLDIVCEMTSSGWRRLWPTGIIRSEALTSAVPLLDIDLLSEPEIAKGTNMNQVEVPQLTQVSYCQHGKKVTKQPPKRNENCQAS